MAGSAVVVNHYVTKGNASTHGPDGVQARIQCRQYLQQASKKGNFRCGDELIGHVAQHEVWNATKRKAFLDDSLEILGNGALPWYRQTVYEETYFNDTWLETWANTMPDDSRGQPSSLNHFSIFWILSVCLILVTVVSAVVESAALNRISSIFAPLWVVWFISELSGWKVYGPITRQHLFEGGFFHLHQWPSYDDSTADCAFAILFTLVIVTLPWYGQIQRNIHRFNTTSLKKAYHHEGDWMLKEMAPNPYCPNIILGACLQDYGRPQDTECYSDFGLTPLFLGGRRTGFWPTAATRLSLATAMGVSGGAVDMALSRRITIARHAIGAFSLQMGTWVRVRVWKPSWFQRCLSAVEVKLSERCRHVRIGLHDNSAVREWLEENVMCLRGTLIAWVWYCILIYMSFEISKDAKDCFSLPLRLGAYMGMIGFLMAQSYSFFPGFSEILRSPVGRHFMMIFHHFHKSWDMPEYLYLLDGGLVDCLGVYDLLRRKERWILALDAASPAHDVCRFVRVLIELAHAERMCSFADPLHPGRHWTYVLDDFEKNTDDAAVLHLRIHYEPWGQSGEAEKIGDIFFTSMRIPDDDREVQKQNLDRTILLQAPHQVVVEPSRRFLDDGTPLLRKNLRGVCCCDACHDNVPECCQLPCGKFPSITMTNQFLTPRLFSEICRLGHELSEQAVDAMLAEMKKVEETQE